MYKGVGGVAGSAQTAESGQRGIYEFV